MQNHIMLRRKISDVKGHSQTQVQVMDFKNGQLIYFALDEFEKYEINFFEIFKLGCLLYHLCFERNVLKYVNLPSRREFMQGLFSAAVIRKMEISKKAEIVMVSAFLWK